MLNKLMLGVALGALALSGAMAQSNPPASTDQPAAQSPAPSQSMPPQSTTSTPAKTETTGQQTQTTGGDKIIASQQSNQWLASKFQGTDVIGTDDKKIGDVNDVLFEQNG